MSDTTHATTEPIAEPVAESAEPSPFRHLSGPHTISSDSGTVGLYYLRAEIADDTDPDTSYLDQDAPDCDFRDRKAAYDRGDFTFHGVIVRIYADDDPDNYVLGESSLWGIESDSHTDYWREVANDLAAELLGGIC